MNKNLIIYWIATVWLSLGMISSGIIQLLQTPEEVEFINNLGYPTYLLLWLGVTKILAVIAILVPKYPLVKEWAYAGLFFMMTGAIYSHIANGDVWTAILPGLLLVILTVVSWYFRPADRKLALNNGQSN